MYLLFGGGEGALFISGIEVQSVSEHVWVGGSGLRGGVGLPAGGICALKALFLADNKVDKCTSNFKIVIKFYVINIIFLLIFFQFSIISLSPSLWLNYGRIIN